jgi:hypothetical protein
MATDINGFFEGRPRRMTGPGINCRRERAGAIFSFELLLVLPILLTICLGMVELSMLLMGMQRVQAASLAACRVGTLPASDQVYQRSAMEGAAWAAMGSTRMSDAATMTCQLAQHAGESVVVEVSVPMTAASPDLLKIIGFSLQGRTLDSRTEMCRQ